MLYSVSEVRVFASGLNHPEGVAVGRNGTVYSGGEAGEVYRISPDGDKVDVIANTGGFCLGVALDEDENIFVCDCAKRTIFRIQQNGEVAVFAESVENQPFRNPNFGVFDSRSNFYFSDSGDWKKANGIVCRSDRYGCTTLFAPGPFHFANGLALDSLERHVYLAESNLDRVLQIEINPDGSAGSTEVYAEGFKTIPDGLAFDARGNLYVTTYGSSAIYRVSPNRHVELLCQDAENELLCLATNCAFAGPNFDQLLVANLGHLHISVLDLKTKGQPLANHRKRNDASAL